MPKIVEYLHSKNMIPRHPAYIVTGMCYEVIMGSFAYGVSSDTSDLDVYGFCIPDREVMFPHEAGWVNGFEATPNNFEQFQKHHINVEGDPKTYDVTIFNIAKYFRLVAEGNPNMIDSLFVPERCVTAINEIGALVRENRKLFLSKKCWHTFKGYAYSQMNKMRTKSPDAGSKRIALVEKYGYDVKFAYHLVRLLNEVEQILNEHDLDLERNREQLKEIRRGAWKTIGDVEHYFMIKEHELEKIYNSSALQHGVDRGRIRMLLHECLDMHFKTSKRNYKGRDTLKRSLDQMDRALAELKAYNESLEAEL